MNIDSRPKHSLFFRLALYPPSPYQARSRRDTQDGLRGAVSRRAAILLDHSDPWRHRLGLRILPPGFHLRLLQLGRRRRPILHRESRRFVLVQLTTRPLNTGFAPFNLVDLSVGRSWKLSIFPELRAWADCRRSHSRHIASEDLVATPSHRSSPPSGRTN